jgi:hypothetical protein
VCNRLCQPLEDRILVQSTLNGRASSAGHNELLEAFESFATNVRIVLMREFPELLKQPQWGPWLKEGLTN